MLTLGCHLWLNILGISSLIWLNTSNQSTSIRDFLDFISQRVQIPRMARETILSDHQGWRVIEGSDPQNGQRTNLFSPSGLGIFEGLDPKNGQRNNLISPPGLENLRVQIPRMARETIYSVHQGQRIFGSLDPQNGQRNYLISRPGLLNF